LTRASTLDLYRSREVAQILGISRRQLQYWAQTDLVRPSLRSPGGHHRYTFQDLIALKAAKRLIDAGVSVQRLRKSIRALRRILPTVRRPLAELVLVATGDIVLVVHQGSAFEAATGQEWVFEVARFQREVEAWKRKPTPLAKRRSAPSSGSEAAETEAKWRSE
jgi:DNA-binding transcriptional MerR regulator